MDITLKNLTPEQIEAIKKVVGETKEFPQRGDRYWYYDEGGYVDWSEWENYVYDKNRLSIGNCFKTKEEAQDHVNWLKARASLVREIARLNDGWVYEGKGGLVIWYSHYLSELGMISTRSIQEIPTNMILEDENKAEQLIKTHEQELRTYLGVK